MLDISIVIVNWNTEDLLCDCIASIIETTKKCSYEIIVVDNASADDSVEAVQKKYPDVTVVKNIRNEGFARANNFGIKRCKGQYVCLSNTDIKVLDCALDRMFDFMQENPNAGITLPKLYDDNMEISLCCRDFPSLMNLFNEALYAYKINPWNRIFKGRDKPIEFYYQTGKIDTVPLCFTMVRADAIKDVGLLDEHFFFYGEDLDWCKRFVKAEWEIMYYHGAEAIHYGGASTKKRPFRFLVEKSKTMLQYMNKHHGRYAAQLSKGILVLHYMLRYVGLSMVKYTSKRGADDRYNDKIASYRKMAKWLLANRYDKILTSSKA